MTKNTQLTSPETIAYDQLIPPELWMEIGQYAKTKTISRLSQTCTTLHGIFAHSHYQRALHEIFGNQVVLMAGQSAQQHFQRLQRLRLHVSNQLKFILDNELSSFSLMERAILKLINHYFSDYLTTDLPSILDEPTLEPLAVLMISIVNPQTTFYYHLLELLLLIGFDPNTIATDNNCYLANDELDPDSARALIETQKTYIGKSLYRVSLTADTYHLSTLLLRFNANLLISQEEAQSKLYLAATIGNLELVKKIVSEMDEQDLLDCFAVYDQEFSPLQCAIFSGEHAIVTYLYQSYCTKFKKLDLSMKEDLLVTTASINLAPMLLQLLELMDLKTIFTTPQTEPRKAALVHRLIYCVAKNNCLETLQLLIDLGLQLTTIAFDKKHHPLNAALINQHGAMVKLLIENGIDFTAALPLLDDLLQPINKLKEDPLLLETYAPILHLRRATMQKQESEHTDQEIIVATPKCKCAIC
jgi:hypothetical protein